MHRKATVLIRNAQSSALGFEKFVLATKRMTIPPELDAFIAGAGMRAQWTERTAPFTVNAVRAPRMISCWVRTGQIEVQWRREASNELARSLFVFMNFGTLTAESGDAIEHLRAGEALVVSPQLGQSTLALRSTSGASELLLLSMDSALIGVTVGTLRRIERLDDRATISVAFGAGHGLAHAPLPSSPASAAAIQASVAAVGRALIATLDRGGPRDEDLYFRTNHFIRVHARDSGLTVRQIAEVLGASVRTLQVLYQKHNTTPLTELRRQRYLNAIDLLAHEPLSKRQSIASRAGFRTTKQMNDAMRDFG